MRHIEVIAPDSKIRFAAALIVAVAVAAYANSFTNLFSGLDAKESIRDNPHIRKLWPLTEAMSLPLLADTEGADPGSKGGTVVRRPILSLTFALNSVLLGGSPNSFHAVNLAIHVVAALLLFGIVRRTLLSERFEGRYGDGATWLAMAAALLWVAHPVQTEGVTYIVQRAESLMGCFVLASLYCAIRGFEIGAGARWYAGSVAACGLGIATKEVAVVAPLLVLLYDGTFVSGSVARAWRRRRQFYVALACTWAILAALIVLTLTDVSSDFTEGRNLTYALTQPRIILHYLRMAVWPHPLYLYVNTSLYDGLGTLELGASVIVVAAAFAASCWAVYRRHPLGFLGAWFFVILAPSSSIVAVSDIVQEHRMYLPLAAIVVAVVMLTDAVVIRSGEAGGPRARMTIGAAMLAAVVLAFTMLTHQRNADFHSEFGALHAADLGEAFKILALHYTLGQGDLPTELARAEAVVAAEGPDSRDLAYAYYLLGTHRERTEPAWAAHQFERAIEVQPDLATAHNKLAETLLRQGKNARAEAILERTAQRWPRFLAARYNYSRALLTRNRLAEAQAELEEILTLDRNFAAAHNVLGVVVERRGDLERAVTAYHRAVALDPLMDLAYLNLARVLEAQGRIDDAQAELAQVVKLYPGNKQARHELARLLDLGGDVAGAQAALEAGVERAPDDANAYARLGALREKQGDLAGAEQKYSEALAINPRHVGAHNALGTLQARQGRFDEAAPHFESVLAMYPDNADAHANLGAVLASAGRLPEASTHLKRVLRIDPQRHLANFNLALMYTSQGQPDRARSHYEREIAINPDHALSHYNLALLLEAAGDTQSAARHYERTVAIAPGLDDARNRLARLRAKSP